MSSRSVGLVFGSGPGETTSHEDVKMKLLDCVLKNERGARSMQSLVVKFECL